MAIVPVELTDSAPCEGASLWLVLLNGRRIEVGLGFDAVTLERLIAVADAV